MQGAQRFDLVVVGAGPGGYVAAIRAAQLGLHVAVVEEDRLGGVCLNWGCIPSKALLTGAELVENLTRHGETFGVTAAGLALDYGKLIDHSRKTADRLTKGVQGLFKKNQIEWIQGRGRLDGPSSVVVSGADGEQRLDAGHVLLATGSSEWVPPGIDVDGERVLTSREALESRRMPERIVIIGAGAVGIEFAYVYAMYGASVTVVEMADQILPGADPDVAVALGREFRRKGIEVKLGARFEAVKPNGDGVSVTVSQDGSSEELAADQLLAAIGRRARSEALGLETAGVAVDERGFVTVGADLRTAAPKVLAIGDLVGGPLLAHKASEEGIAAAETIAGERAHPLDAGKIPFCIYAQPQVAWIGLTEPAARERYGDDLRVGSFPFTASGKAIAAAHTPGFAKILAEPQHGEIVGAHIVGHGATELVAEIGLAMTLEATTREVVATCHAHPTLSEALHEAPSPPRGERSTSRSTHVRLRTAAGARRVRRRGHHRQVVGQGRRSRRARPAARRSHHRQGRRGDPVARGRCGHRDPRRGGRHDRCRHRDRAHRRGRGSRRAARAERCSRRAARRRPDRADEREPGGLAPRRGARRRALRGVGLGPVGSRDEGRRRGRERDPFRDARCAAAAAPEPAPTPRPAAAAPAPAPTRVDHDEAMRAKFGQYQLQEGDEVVPMSPLRKIVAEHMVYSKRTSPHVGTVAEVDMGLVVAQRNQAKRAFQEQHGFKLTYLPFIVHAVVRALREFPILNSSVIDETIVTKKDVNVGIAVETEKGLVVPVVRQADRYSLAGLAAAVEDLADRARSKRISADDLKGGTFTVSNPGRRGNLYGFAIINQPQVGILRLGEMVKRPVVKDIDGEDAIVVRPMMHLALSYDHRAVDGAPANAFLFRIRELLEEADFDL